MSVVRQPIGKAVLYVSSNVAPEAHAPFSEWCNTIHHFDTMRIEGFLSLRRFELVEGVTDGDTTEFTLLTLYQVVDAGNADFSTPSYAQHTATYTPPPAGVTDHITFERTVYERVGNRTADTQPVGAACATLVGEDGDWLGEAATSISRLHGVLNAYRVTGEAGGVLLVDVKDVDSGRSVLSVLEGIDHGGRRRSAQLFGQVFPAAGVLVRDRQFVEP